MKRNVFRSFKRPNEKKGKKKESQMVLSFQEERIDQQPKELTDAEKQLFQEAFGKGNEGETSKACIAGQQGASNIIGQTTGIPEGCCGSRTLRHCISIF